MIDGKHAPRMYHAADAGRGASAFAKATARSAEALRAKADIQHPGNI